MDFGQYEGESTYGWVHLNDPSYEKWFKKKRAKGEHMHLPQATQLALSG